MLLYASFRTFAPIFPLTLAAIASGCGAGDSGGANSPNGRNLPQYAGDSADQFDDAIEPHAVGLALETYSAPKDDPKLRLRAHTADVVLRARVTTVTGQVSSGVRSYQLSFHAMERLAGKHPVGDEFTVDIDRTSPALGIVRSMEGQLVGKTLVIFAKTFARSDGEPVIHFHASADGADTAAAVKEAVVLDEVK